MKKFLLVIASTALLSTFTFSSVVLSPTVAEAKNKTTCLVLNKTYKKGVRKSAKTVNKIFDRKTKRLVRSEASKAKVSSSLYAKYKYLDYDKDGIACEKK